jgi:formiminotetrahydrofolate cyclodeaminase
MIDTKDFTDALTSMGVDVTVNKNPTNEELDRIKKLIDKNESIKKDVQSYLKGDVDLEYLNEKGIKIAQPIN